MPPRSLRIQVDEIEDALFVELIGIVELAGDDASAIVQVVNVAVDERLVVQTLFAARRIARLIALERTEPVDQPIGLRSVIVRQDRQVATEHGSVLIVLAVLVVVLVVVRFILVSARRQPRHLHRLGAAGQLPQQLVAAAERIAGTWRGFGLQGLGELDAVHQIVLEARALRHVELVAVAVARAQSLIALSGLVQRVEVHDQIELVVRRVRHPGEGVGVVGAGLVEDGERLAVTRSG